MGSVCLNTFHLLCLTVNRLFSPLRDARPDTLDQILFCLCVCHSVLCWVGSPQRVETSTDPWEGSGHSDPLFLSLCQLFFLTLHVMQEQHLSRRAAPLETAYFSAAGWLIGFELSCWDQAQRTAKVRCASICLHMTTHTHTHFPLLISINHWPFCKCCWLPIINDYTLLAAGKVTRVKAGPFTGHYSVEVCVVIAKKRKNFPFMFMIMTI